MRTRIGIVLGMVAVLAAIAIPAVADNHNKAAVTRDQTRVATLTGLGETTPVDSAGVGLASITVDAAKRLLCYELVVTGVTPTGAHIHEGAAGVNGGVVVDLGAFGQPLGALSTGCADGLDKALLKDIKANPTDYYVNVHTAANPGGELRGQLSK